VFDDGLRTFHQPGNVLHLIATFVRLVTFFDDVDRPEVAATLYGGDDEPSVGVRYLCESGHPRAG
jgi:hypothetical protein